MILECDGEGQENDPVCIKVIVEGYLNLRLMHTIQTQECFVRKISSKKLAIIEYHIMLSPVYCVPMLYFNMAINSAPASLDDVYHHLVRQPDVSKDVNWEETLRAVGVHGAISQGVSK